MKLRIFLTLLFISTTAISFSQTKKIAIVITNSEKEEPSYDKQIKDFLKEHLRKLQTLQIADFNRQISKEVKDDIGTTISGDFTDTAITTYAKLNNIDKLILVYYSASPFEKKMTISGVTKISYGCRTNIYVQIIDIRSNQILNSKHYNGSCGTAIMSNENYKTKEDAVKASLKALTPDYDDKIKSLDDYFKMTLSL